jgi:hypothetical protein
MLKQGPYWSPIQPWAFVKAALKKLLYLCSGNSRHFSRQGHRKINKLSLLEPVTGNFNSLMSQENSLFFLSPDGRPRLAKHSELCSMPSGAMRGQEPKTSRFPC